MTGLLLRRFLGEYARRPLNVALLVIVPVVFVLASAGAIADFARILGGTAGVGQLEAATAPWAASFLAGVAGFFHVAGSRDVDRRLAAAGAGAGRVAWARLGSSVVLALLAAVAALLALALRTDLSSPGRVVAATLMSVLVYLGIGAAVGSVVRSEMNGSLVIIFIWMLDVFFGPAMGGATGGVTRAFPGHFATLYLLDPTSHEGGRLGVLGAALVWTGLGLALAAVPLILTTRPSRGRAGDASAVARLAAGVRFAWREYRRSPALWVLLLGLPLLFISASIAITPDEPTPVDLVDAGVTTTSMWSMADVHGAVMVPITVAFLAGLAGLFVVLGSAQADRRLVVAGFRPREVLASRLAVIVAAAVLVSGVSLAVTAADFTPRQWFPFVAATVLVALTYAMIGVVLGPLLGRLGGLYAMFVLPFLDVGIAQNVMFDAAPPGWGVWLPARGAVRLLVDGAFTSTMDVTGALPLALGWLAVTGAAAVLVFRRMTSLRA